MDDFLIKAMIAGIGVAIIAGPMGSLIVWKRMAFFGDALSHSALLGVALAFLINIHHILGIIFITTLFSLLIVVLQKNRSYSTDTLMGIIAHSSLALGIVVVSFIERARIDLVSFLFGDVLATSSADIIMIYGAVIFSVIMLYSIWKPLLLTTVSEDLARVEGVNVEMVGFKFMLLISLLVAVSIKVVGILLVTSLLVIPAAAARKYSKTPEHMAIISGVFGIIAVTLGLLASLKFDTPSGPTIVVVALILFIVSSLRKNSL
jgi:zinc transport system permease protein